MNKQLILKGFFIILMFFFFISTGCSDQAEKKSPPEDKMKEPKQTSSAESEAKQEVKPETQPEQKAEPEPESKPAKKRKPDPEPKTSKPKKAVASDIIEMNNPAYETHTQGIVLFTHTKHTEEYKIGCGKCHHDENGIPITGLKPGDPVDSCISCHDKPGRAPRSEPKLTDKEKLAYHSEALHKNCITCHRSFNKDNNTKKAPVSCSKCHPRKE